jgi:general L-amino acid transport system permease protein
VFRIPRALQLGEGKRMSVVTGGDAPPKVAFFNDPRVRSWTVQIVLVLLVGYFFWQMFNNTVENLRQANIASGYGFLNTTAGFDLSFTLLSYSETSTYGRAIAVGILNTLLVAVCGIVAATIVGFVVGVMRLSKNWLVAKVADLFVEVMRNVPLLIQLLIWYKVVLAALPQPRNALSLGDTIFLSNRGITIPKFLWGDTAWIIGVAFLAAIAGIWLLRRWAHARQEATGEQFPVFLSSLGLLFGLPLLAYFSAGQPLALEYPEQGNFNLRGGVGLVPEFAALFLGLSLYTAAFIGEIVRAGILAVNRGQTEASHALGLRSGPTLRLIIFPQAMRVIIPPLASQYLNLTKNSSLAVAIGYPELVAAGGTVMNQSGQAMEVISIWMAVYLTFSLVTSLFMNWFNARMRLVER